MVLDFSNVRIKQNGQFDQKQLETVVEKSARLTELICYQVVHIMQTQQRRGVFFFATTKKHAYEIMSHLPPEESAIILGDTPQDERTKILDKARTGEIKYLVNIAIISVGVDVPAYDTIAYLRPTESLVLLVQTMGRVLRLSPQTQKTNALVLDFAGNIERHSDWDNPILLEALKQTRDPEKPLVIICPRCAELNTDTARRCTGISHKSRCDYYFEFKKCPSPKCETQNDIAARHCRTCQAEIIDPNEKLSMELALAPKELDVIGAEYTVADTKSFFQIKCVYKCKDIKGASVYHYESFTPSSPKARNVFYGQFVRKHCVNPSDWYLHLDNRTKIEEMLQVACIPHKIVVKREDNKYNIKKKIFA